jgi:hypothetical protein
VTRPDRRVRAPISNCRQYKVGRFRGAAHRVAHRGICDNAVASRQLVELHRDRAILEPELLVWPVQTWFVDVEGEGGTQHPGVVYVQSAHSRDRLLTSRRCLP